MNNKRVNEDEDEHNDGDGDEGEGKNVSSLYKNLHLLFLCSN